MEGTRPGRSVCLEMRLRWPMLVLIAVVSRKNDLRLIPDEIIPGHDGDDRRGEDNTLNDGSPEGRPEISSRRCHSRCNNVALEGNWRCDMEDVLYIFDALVVGSSGNDVGYED